MCCCVVVDKTVEPQVHHDLHLDVDAADDTSLGASFHRDSDHFDITAELNKLDAIGAAHQQVTAPENGTADAGDDEHVKEDVSLAKGETEDGVTPTQSVVHDGSTTTTGGDKPGVKEVHHEDHAGEDKDDEPVATKAPEVPDDEENAIDVDEDHHKLRSRQHHEMSKNGAEKETTSGTKATASDLQDETKSIDRKVNFLMCAITEIIE